MHCSLVPKLLGDPELYYLPVFIIYDFTLLFTIPLASVIFTIYQWLFYEITQVTNKNVK